jgi:hypothetical protein
LRALTPRDPPAPSPSPQTTTPSTVDLATLKSSQPGDRSSRTSNTDNTITIEAWNTVLFEKFCRFRHVLSLGLAGHSDELFRRTWCACAR